MRTEASCVLATGNTCWIVSCATLGYMVNYTIPNFTTLFFNRQYHLWKFMMRFPAIILWRRKKCYPPSEGIFTESAPLSWFSHRVAMIICLFLLPDAVFLGLSFALRSHDQFPGPNWFSLPLPSRNDQLMDNSIRSQKYIFITSLPKKYNSYFSKHIMNYIFFYYYT